MPITSNEPAPPEKKLKVFLLAGQSNMVGHGSVAQLPPNLTQLPSNVTYFQRSKSGAVIHDFVSLKSFGPEITFAHEIAKAMPEEKILLVKHAAGGVSLPAWSPQWTPQLAALTNNQNAGPLYQQLQESIAQATRGLDFQFAAVIWHQGGRDMKFPSAYKDYATNLKLLIEAFRRDTKTPNLPFIFAKLADPAAKTLPPELADSREGVAAVRAAQIEVSQQVANTSLIESQGLTYDAGLMHLDTPGQIELGRRFAKAYLELVKVPASNQADIL